MTLEPGLTSLDELEVDLGGLLVTDAPFAWAGDEGLDGVETDANDLDLSIDGASPGYQRIPARAVTLSLGLSPENAADAIRGAAMAVAMHSLELVMQPLPDRNLGRRMLRWRRRGEPAKRLYYRPAHGTALRIPGDEARLKYDVVTEFQAHLDCPDGVIVSDEYEDIVFGPGDLTQTVTNLGTLASLPPALAYTITASNDVGLTNDTHGGSIFYTAAGGTLTVSRRHEVETSTGRYGLAYGYTPAFTPWVHPLVMYPGDNTITATAACTLRAWSTW